MSNHFEGLLELQAAQDADAQAIQEAVAKAEEDVDQVDRRHLIPEEVREHVQQVRDAAVTSLRDRRTAMLKRAEAARNLRDHFSPDALRRAALVDDASAITPLMPLWQSLPTRELVTALKDAVQAGNVAAAECIRVIFQSREDRGDHASQFSSEFSRLLLPLADEGLHRCGEIIRAAATADVRLLELMRGRREPVARLNASRAGRTAR